MITQVAAWIGAIAGLGGIGTTLAMLLKARPEGRKTNADAAKVIQETSAEMVKSIRESVREDLTALRLRVAELEREREERRRKDDQQERRLRVHQAWDEQVSKTLRDLGQSIPDPPPLYPEPTTA